MLKLEKVCGPGGNGSQSRRIPVATEVARRLAILCTPWPASATSGCGVAGSLHVIVRLAEAPPEACGAKVTTTPSTPPGATVAGPEKATLHGAGAVTAETTSGACPRL